MSQHLRMRNKLLCKLGGHYHCVQAWVELDQFESNAVGEDDGITVLVNVRRDLSEDHCFLGFQAVLFLQHGRNTEQPERTARRNANSAEPRAGVIGMHISGESAN